MGELSREGAGRKGLAAATAPGADGGDDGDCGGDGDEDDDGVLPSWIHNRKCQGKAVRSCRSETAADPAKELGSTIGRSDPFTTVMGICLIPFAKRLLPCPDPIWPVDHVQREAGLRGRYTVFTYKLA